MYIVACVSFFMSSWHWESHAAQHNLHRSNVSGNTLDLQGVDVEEVTCLAPKRLANHSAYPMASPQKRPWHQKCPCAQNAWALYYNTKWVKLIYSIYYNIEFGQVLMSFWAWQNQMFHLSFVSFIMGIPCTFPFFGWLWFFLYQSNAGIFVSWHMAMHFSPS